MKTRLLLILVLLSSPLIVFAQKKSARIISPLALEFKMQSSKRIEPKEMTKKNGENRVKNEENTTTAVNEEKTTTAVDDNSENNEFSNIDKQLKIDMAFIAYLMKDQIFNFKYKKEVSAKYDTNYIAYLVSKFTPYELNKMAKGHDKKLKKYSL